MANVEMTTEAPDAATRALAGRGGVQMINLIRYCAEAAYADRLTHRSCTTRDHRAIIRGRPAGLLSCLQATICSAAKQPSKRARRQNMNEADQPILRQRFGEQRATASVQIRSASASSRLAATR